MRGQEAIVIKRFAADHPRHEGHTRDVAIDNGFADEPDWMDGMPGAYRSVSEQYNDFGTPSRSAA